MSDLIALIGTNEEQVCPPAVAAGGDGQQGYPGRKGNPGANGRSGFTYTTASFVTGVNVEIPVENGGVVGYVFIEGAGMYYVSEVNDNVLTATSTGETGNLPHNSVIPAGRLVTSGAVAGPDVTTDEVRPYVLLGARVSAGTDIAGQQLLRRTLVELVDTHDACTMWTNDTFFLNIGTWAIRATSGSFKQGSHQLNLTQLNNPSSTVGTTVRGTNEWDDKDIPTVVTRSNLFALSVITNLTFFALIHTAQSPGGSNGFGVAANFGVPETYAFLEARMA